MAVHEEVRSGMGCVRQLLHKIQHLLDVFRLRMPHVRCLVDDVVKPQLQSVLESPGFPRHLAQVHQGREVSDLPSMKLDTGLPKSGVR